MASAGQMPLGATFLDGLRERRGKLVPGIEQESSIESITNMHR